MSKGVLSYMFQTVSNPPQHQSLDSAQRELVAPIKTSKTRFYNLIAATKFKKNNSYNKTFSMTRIFGLLDP